MKTRLATYCVVISFWQTAFSEDKCGKCLVKLRPMETIQEMAAKNESAASRFVKVAASGHQKLSIPLLATLASGATLIGYTELDRSAYWIMEGPNAVTAALTKSGLSLEVRSEIPTKYQEVQELSLIYDKAAKPSQAELAEAGLVIVKDRERKDYGYMNVRRIGDAKGFPASVLKKIEGMEGIREADANVSVTVLPR